MPLPGRRNQRGVADGLTRLSLPQLSVLTGHGVCDLSQYYLQYGVDLR